MDKELAAKLAKDIIENPLWDATCAALQMELFYLFQAVDPGDAKALNDIAAKAWALREIRAEIERRLADANDEDNE